MKEHLTISQSGSPTFVHNYLFDGCHIFSFAYQLDYRLSGNITSTDRPPAIEPDLIVDTNCEVIRTNVYVLGFHLEISLADDHVVPSTVDHRDLGQCG
jgi:hypothetical protein